MGPSSQSPLFHSLVHPGRLFALSERPSLPAICCTYVLRHRKRKKNGERQNSFFTHATISPALSRGNNVAPRKTRSGQCVRLFGLIWHEFFLAQTDQMAPNTGPPRHTAEVFFVASKVLSRGSRYLGAPVCTRPLRSSSASRGLECEVLSQLGQDEPASGRHWSHRSERAGRRAAWGCPLLLFFFFFFATLKPRVERCKRICAGRQHHQSPQAPATRICIPKFRLRILRGGPKPAAESDASPLPGTTQIATMVGKDSRVVEAWLPDLPSENPSGTLRILVYSVIHDSG